MAALREIVVVGEDQELVVHKHVRPGRYIVEIRLESEPDPDDFVPARGKLTFPDFDLGEWPPGTTFSRDELYGDDDER